MKLQVNEFSKLTGVSVRTLHYYDGIGLLKPACTDAHSGYRYYDENSLARMQEILFFRELDFPLKTICSLLSSPEHSREEALKEQRKLLILKKERLERLISAVDGALKGDIIMDAFGSHEFEQYKAEVKARWGDTAAYAEYSEKSRGASQKDTAERAKGLDDVLGRFALCMNSGSSPDSEEAQALVIALQEYITANFYTCTTEILAGLGSMYTSDDRFRKNIDRHSSGTAEYISLAIRYFCGKHASQR